MAIVLFAVWVVSAATQGEEITGNWSKIEEDIRVHAKKMADACVSIQARNGAWGSGVIVSESGILFSAAHVFKSPGETVTVFLAGNRKVKANILHTNAKHDIAVLKLVEPVSRIKPAPVCRYPNLVQGTTYVAAGHASGFNAERRSPLRVGFGFLAPRHGKIYSTCRITAGDSGGPLYSETGVVQAIHHTMDGKGKYAAHIPVQRFFQLWPELKEAIVTQ